MKKSFNTFTVAMTGASGTMGKEAVREIMRDPSVQLRVLLRRTRRGRTWAASLRRRYRGRAEILFGDIRSYGDCLRLCRDAEYLIHLAAVIPPTADHDETLTMTTNLDGTKNLVNAVLETGNRTKLLHISTVAIYGHRNEKHPWGRVGDPLVTSAFDVYGLSKTMAEYAVLESGIEHWAVLRQTGILYDNILMNNIRDGLMFHTPWNVPIEWVTAKDSGILLANILRQDRSGATDGFWKQVYNIGGGEAARQTGYETFDDGFRLIGGSVKHFFEPNWNLPRNFHCFWFSDSDELEKRFHFRTQGCADFWKWYIKRHPLYRAGRIMPPGLLRKLVIEPLLKNSNAPAYWLSHKDTARIQAYFGGWEKYHQLPDSWEQTDLLCEDPSYEEKKRYDPALALDHGYDESKADDELGIKDMQEAAAFRGGECLSESMEPGAVYQKLQWRCHEGHVFEATPFTILKAGHWCPRCCQTDREWRMDIIAKYSPFHAQVWRDSHAPEESYVYSLRNGAAHMEERV